MALLLNSLVLCIASFVLNAAFKLVHTYQHVGIHHTSSLRALRDYLETALLAVPGNSGAAAAKNQIRASIKSLFPDRDCFTLVRPMNEESALVSLDRVPRSQLRPEFRSVTFYLLVYSTSRRYIICAALGQRLAT